MTRSDDVINEDGHDAVSYTHLMCIRDSHTVEEAIAHLSLWHNAAQLQDAVGHGRLAVVDVCDDTEVANHRLIRGTRLIVLDDQRIPPLGIYSNFT